MVAVFDPRVYGDPVYDEVLIVPEVYGEGESDPGFLADAIILKTQSGSFTADAILKKTQSASFTLDAVIRVPPPEPTDFSVAVFDPQVYGEPLLTPLLIVPETYGERYLEDLDPTQRASFDANAIILKSQTASFTADAILKKTQSASFTLDAVIAVGAYGFLADAVILKTQSGSLTVDAVVFRTQSAGLTADAIIRKAQTASLTADAVIKKTQSASLTANAVLLRTQSATKTADAILKRTQSASFTADAVIAHIVTFTADAVIKASRTGSFTASAWIYAPRADPSGPGEPGETPLVSIMVAGEDVTADVMLSDATFTMLTNGGVGTFHFRVRDDAHERHFITGSEVTVDIDGIRRFGGYLMQPKRLFAFPVEDTTDPERPSRFHVLEGVDYNILFQKRIVRNKDNPADVGLRSWPAGSDSDVVIKYVFDNYTDLGADGVTYLGVTNVGSPNPDKPGIIASGGLTFGDAMREINRLISGVWYINAYKDLNYVDVDTPTNDLILTDHPTGGDMVGYRDFTHTENGTGLVNDALVWGAGMGSRLIKFSRSTDDPSIALHGLWQMGEFTTGLFRQASVDERASTIVYGTDQSKRGGKDDQVSWTATSFNNTWEAGQKVEVVSDVWGITDVVPIRRLTLTFPTKRKPRFDLVLSHEIDEPWNLFEFWFPKFGGWPPPPPITIFEPPTGDCECGITDDYARTVASGWGTASSGLIWFNTSGTGRVSSVDGTAGILQVTTTNTQAQVRATGLGTELPVYPTPTNLYFDFEFSNIPSHTVPPPILLVELGGDSQLRMSLDPSTNPGLVGIINSDFFGNVPEAFITLSGQKWRCHVLKEVIGSDTWWRAKIWDPVDPEPSSWLVYDSRAGFVDTVSDVLNFTLIQRTVDTDFKVRISNLRYFYGDPPVELTRCINVQFDDFNRTVASGWGTATPSGYTWSQTDGTATTSVNGTQGVVSLSATDFNATMESGYPSETSTGFTQRMTFLFTSTPSGSNAIFISNLGVFPSGPGIRIDTNGTSNIGIAGGGSSPQITFIPNSFWGSNRRYIVEWTIDPGVLNQVSIWRDIFPDTVYTASQSTPTGTVPADLTKWDFSASFTTTVRVDSIDFFYDRPCFYDCGYLDGSYEVYDDFTRTLASTWGTATCGTAWVLSGSGLTASVNGTQGRISGTASSASFFQRTATGTPTGANKINLPCDISFDVVTLTTGLTGRAEFGFDVSAVGDPYFVFYPTINNSGTAGSRLTTDAGGTTYVTGPAVSAGTTVYIICTTTDVTVIYGSNSLTQPWRDLSGNPFTPTPSVSAIHFNAGVSGNGNSMDFIVDNVQVKDQINWGTFCAAGDSAGTGGPPTQGPQREDQLGDGTSTVYVLGADYIPGSTRVFIGGRFQMPGVEFTETGPDEITFTTPPALSAVITIFYEVKPV